MLNVPPGDRRRRSVRRPPRARSRPLVRCTKVEPCSCVSCRCSRAAQVLPADAPWPSPWPWP